MENETVEYLYIARKEEFDFDKGPSSKSSVAQDSQTENFLQNFPLFLISHLGSKAPAIPLAYSPGEHL
ncbi:MAG: hypothetical protein IPH57_00155 [Saprospiraceae bacterium]|nr:hypothetical protein [Saprospiraceae bacterium]